MEMEMSVVLDLWELIVDNVNNARKEEIATKFVAILANQGLEKSDFDSISGEDEYLDNAVVQFFGDDSYDDELPYEDDYDQ